MALPAVSAARVRISVHSVGSAVTATSVIPASLAVIFSRTISSMRSVSVP